jgi:hypothetical protein
MFEEFSDTDWMSVEDDEGAFSSAIKDLISENATIRKRALTYIEEHSTHQDTLDPVVPHLIPFLAHIIGNDSSADKAELLHLLTQYGRQAHPSSRTVTTHRTIAQERHPESKDAKYHRDRLLLLNQTYQAIVKHTPTYRLMLHHNDYGLRIEAFHLLVLCLVDVPEVNKAIADQLKMEASPEAFCAMIDSLVEFVSEDKDQVPNIDELYRSIMQNLHAGMYDAHLEDQLEYLSTLIDD